MAKDCDKKGTTFKANYLLNVQPTICQVSPHSGFSFKYYPNIHVFCSSKYSKKCLASDEWNAWNVKEESHVIANFLALHTWS